MHAWSAPRVPNLPRNTNPEIDDRVRVWDTESRALKAVGPASGTAGLYVCGITPYDATHLGHAFTYLTFDLLQRAWRDLGLDVSYVQNITDVDDPLLERANQTGQDWEELAASQVELFRADMAALRILPPEHYIAATEALDLVTGTVEKLEAKNLAYQVKDETHPDWYFRSDAVEGFGEMSHLNRDEQLVEFADKGGDPERPGKVDALDSLVWRMARDGEPSWPSPLGRGRPGWHVECTAIAQRYLGADFSVQGGGSDLAFPHHEMCAAVGRAVTGERFADAYVHVGMVALDGQKMSKSLGNLELVSRLRGQGIAAPVIRLALLTHHYRTDWEWFATDIDKAQRRADAWAAAFASPAGTPTGPVLDDLRRAMRDDLNSPEALAIVDEWSAATLAGDGEDVQSPTQVAEAVDALLGISLN
ncbi:cysteine--1-D-myo-inosityl 2-amino-2-deoxy-alpha-D-glucopyranoside ligase [Propionimicrobium sp. PCR01-08-3]|uniref:cysteine--1-D-myo-inosityl 2-amino-2-deoxy-alpha-D-glucopyranoside ligase n=1 Tax=Propionimicrobium sp. PCR01-08-3 TaxID=3052086 RepID=UPI00255C7EEB|nr:cysteine--1-D-myo-inosityl 2-amino-2-deoxy-alpha-D-glucopyranoside ligase [Propionimicrobium sp. PCR01-08-3]WIY81517.1 cysteine--1-D-myo-inosityl 2-amino-2-deoxy-alpha-D-glucopyranoside ligase [Propionimicrobium sp. PCR01-08-3]